MVTVNEKKLVIDVKSKAIIRKLRIFLKLSKIIIFTLGLCKPKILSENKINSDELHRPFI